MILNQLILVVLRLVLVRIPPAQRSHAVLRLRRRKSPKVLKRRLLRSHEGHLILHMVFFFHVALVIEIDLRLQMKLMGFVVFDVLGRQVVTMSMIQVMTY